MFSPHLRHIQNICEKREGWTLDLNKHEYMFIHVPLFTYINTWYEWYWRFRTCNLYKEILLVSPLHPGGCLSPRPDVLETAGFISQGLDALLSRILSQRLSRVHTCLSSRTLTHGQPLFKSLLAILSKYPVIHWTNESVSTLGNATRLLINPIISSD